MPLKSFIHPGLSQWNQVICLKLFVPCSGYPASSNMRWYCSSSNWTRSRFFQSQKLLSSPKNINRDWLRLGLTNFIVPLPDLRWDYSTEKEVPEYESLRFWPPHRNGSDWPGHQPATIDLQDIIQSFFMDIIVDKRVYIYIYMIN